MVRCIDCKKLEHCCKKVYICTLDDYVMDSTFVIKNDAECDYFEPLDADHSEE